MPTVYPDCPKYYDGACSEAIGAWLPGFGFASDHTKQATRIRQRDAFVYEHEEPSDPDGLDFQGPSDGTFFVYGGAGPPKGHLVYDYAHHIAFFEQGCCSWQDVVAASSMAPPPKRVVKRDLNDLHTVRSIRLGMNVESVTRIYGRSSLLPVASHNSVKLLAYTTWPVKESNIINSPCGQFENFYFRNDRLVLIQLDNGC
jgi:hypothetical protein